MSYQPFATNLSVYSGSLGATLTQVKSSAGLLYGVSAGNNNTAISYIQVFDAASTSSVTLGTTTPKLSIMLPAGGGIARDITHGIAFTNGIVVACTTTRTGSTAPTNTVDLNLDYL